MRNRVLTLTRNIIPYVKELRSLTDSVVGSILMQQLDYWFERYPNGFYKFLESCDHPKYASGQSWSEEIGISKSEFRTAFDQIGMRWKSKTEFENAVDKFQGKFYASYHDRRENLTFYFRNHDVVDAALDDLIANLARNHNDNGGSQQGIEGVKMALVRDFKADSHSEFTVNQESAFTVNEESELTGSEETESLEIHNVDLQEINNRHINKQILQTEITSEKPLLREAEPEKNRSGGDRLIFPKTFTPLEIDALKKFFSDLDPDQSQAILDEVAGLAKTKKIRTSAMSLAVHLVKKLEEGAFVPTVGLAIAEERLRAAAAREKEKFPPRPTEKKPQIPLRDRLEKAGIQLGHPLF